MRFLYPSVQQFPFDSACAQIVRELEKREWKAPEIEVEFHEYGGFRMVSTIKSRDFKLWFCRVQCTMPDGQWNDTAGISEIVIPKKEIRVYEDESGPVFYLYVGNDYERDRKRFMNGSRINTKLNGEPKLFLKYEGGCDCKATQGAGFSAVSFLTADLSGDTEKLRKLKHTHPGRRSPLLVHDNDLGREYDPEGDEPTLFRTDEVMAEFKKYLEEVVLRMILS